MNIVFDIGNTRTKVAVFDEQAIVFQDATQSLSVDDVKALLNSYGPVDGAIISATKDYDAAITPFLSKVCPCAIELSHETPLPLHNLYKTPQTLGKDRLAAAVGAFRRFPGQGVLIIDAGTAITFDLVTDQAEYIGGNISLGLEMRFRALHQFTGKLPLLTKRADFPAIGQTTEEAMQAGVQNGLLYEIETYVQSLKTKFFSLHIVLTGGDAQYLAALLKCEVDVLATLTLEGLNEILRYNQRLKEEE